MTRRVIILILFMTLPAFAQVNLGNAKSVITTPSISSKCQSLIDKREQKLKMKQTLSALIERNIKLQHQQITDQEVKRKLIANLRKLKHEYILAKNRVRYLTSEIVITGCPGVTL